MRLTIAKSCQLTFVVEFLGGLKFLPYKSILIQILDRTLLLLGLACLETNNKTVINTCVEAFLRILRKVKASSHCVKNGHCFGVANGLTSQVSTQLHSQLTKRSDVALQIVCVHFTHIVITQKRLTLINQLKIKL